MSAQYLRDSQSADVSCSAAEQAAIQKTSASDKCGHTLSEEEEALHAQPVTVSMMLTQKHCALPPCSSCLPLLLKNLLQLVSLAFAQYFRGQKLHATWGLYELFCALSRVLGQGHFSLYYVPSCQYCVSVQDEEVMYIVSIFDSGILWSIRTFAGKLYIKKMIRPPADCYFQSLGFLSQPG